MRGARPASRPRRAASLPKYLSLRSTPLVGLASAVLLLLLKLTARRPSRARREASLPKYLSLRSTPLVSLASGRFLLLLLHDSTSLCFEVLNAAARLFGATEPSALRTCICISGRMTLE